MKIGALYKTRVSLCDRSDPHLLKILKAGSVVLFLKEEFVEEGGPHHHYVLNKDKVYDFVFWDEHMFDIKTWYEEIQ